MNFHVPEIWEWWRIRMTSQRYIEVNSQDGARTLAQLAGSCPAPSQTSGSCEIKAGSLGWMVDSSVGLITAV